MSHELRTPLNSIIGFTNLLTKNKSGNLIDKDLMYLDRIGGNGKHLLGLINDVLDLSKIEADRAELSMEPTNLGIVAREVADAMAGSFAEMGNKLRVIGQRLLSRLRLILVASNRCLSTCLETQTSSQTTELSS